MKNYELKTPEEWSKDKEFMGLQILEDTSKLVGWNRLPVSKEEFCDIFLPKVQYTFNLGKGL